MTLLHLLLCELGYRWIGTCVAVMAVTLAVASVIGSLCVLEVHDCTTERTVLEKQKETQATLAKLNDDMRKATLKLGFNLLILPKEQDLGQWHLKEYGDVYMPEAYVMKLADSGIVTVRHFLPGLQRKILWPETKRTVILIGTRGEVPNMHKNPRNPMVQPVPVGTIVLGHEIHQSLGFSVGDEVGLYGRNFTVHACHDERGNRDDVAIWISLQDAQALLDKKGLINSILALKCLCAGSEDMTQLYDKIAEILPNTQTVEIGTRVIARAEARLKLKQEAQGMVQEEKAHRLKLKAQREGFVATVIPLIVGGCAVWIGTLGYMNMRDRTKEIGMLRAIGYRPGQMAWLFMVKSLLIGIVGGLLGYVLGLFGGGALGGVLDHNHNAVGQLGENVHVAWLLQAMVIASLLTLLSGWIPAWLAAQQDPARILQDDKR